MGKVHEALARCDAFVVGTPIYFFGPSAQTKVFLDRWMALIHSDDGGARHALRGKRMAVAVAYGNVEPVVAGAMNAWRTFRDAAHHMGINLIGWVHGSAPEKGDMAKNAKVLEQATELGRRLCR